MRLVLVVTEREDRPTVLGPERGDPNAVAVILRLVRALSGKDDATIVAQSSELGADETAILIVRRERQDKAALQTHRPQRRVWDVVLGASVACPEKNRLHSRRVGGLQGGRRRGADRGRADRQRDSQQPGP